MKKRKEGESSVWKKYVYYIRTLYLVQCPYSKEMIDRIVKDQLEKIGLIAVGGGAGIWCFHQFFSREDYIYCGFSVLLFWGVCFLEIPERNAQKLQEKIWWEMLQFFEKVKHCYGVRRNISIALEEAAMDASVEIRLHTKQLTKLLEENSSKAIRKYVVEGEQSKYWKLFLIQIYQAVEQGDQKTEDSESLFSENMEHLRLELMEEIYRNKKRLFEFSGYTFVTLTPIFFVPVLKNWGEEFASDLIAYYEGMGYFVVFLGFFTTLAVYFLVRRARNVGVWDFYFRGFRALFERQLYENAEEELRQLQTVVIMERLFHEQQMIHLLEDMETVSNIFSPVIQKCINSYSQGQRQALYRMREEGSKLHPSFYGLADDFMNVEEVGIEAAFAEVENNRRMLERMSQLNHEIQLERKRDGIGMISKIPTMIIVGGYFVVPLLIYSLMEVYRMFEMLESVQY